MSGHKLAVGRILGSGRATSTPAAGPATPARAGGRRDASPFAPSESTLSLGNSSSASGSAGDLPGDLAANISLEGPSNASNSPNMLVCPICEEEMVTLLQLNRHLDDVHPGLPDTQQDEVKTWLDRQVIKAKRFQPLSLLNQKLRGLEVFEPNESAPAAPSPSAAGRGGVATVDDAIDPDELITRHHWQRQSSSDACTDIVCGKRLGPLNGSVNCRGCGKLFCEEHTMYQARLSRAARHDPARGYWARVCETCFKSREGYNDHNGVVVDHSAAFRDIRTKRAERQNLDMSRLEKRLTKLTRLLADPPPDVLAALSPVASSFGGQKSLRKTIEQSVVTWEEDGLVAACPFCRQDFSWTFRRHHCRICGRVVCADPETKCSTDVGLHVAAPARGGAVAAPTEKPTSPSSAGRRRLAVDVRMCRDCSHTIFAKRDFAESLLAKPPDQRTYETLRQFEKGIRLLLPGFQKALAALQDVGGDGRPASKPATTTQARLQEASRMRKRLIDAFSKYGATAKRLRDLPTDSPTQKLLQSQVYAAASAFLHVHMLPLKSVPQMLRQNGHRGPGGHHHHLLLHPSSAAPSVSPLRNGESMAPSDAGDSASQISDASASTVLENEERELRERLVVLEEQRFLIGQMAKTARGARRFEEAGALAKNAEELDVEIGRVKDLVGSVEERWEGFYRDG